jgi:hypothetical protein
LAGITIAALCLWGLSIWQNISLEELFSIFMATIIMLGAIMLGAFMLIVALKLLKRAYHKAAQTKSSKE